MQLTFDKVKKLYAKKTWKPVGPAYPSEPIPPFYDEELVGDEAEIEVLHEDVEVGGPDDPDAARPEEMDPDLTESDSGEASADSDFWSDDDPNNPDPPRRKVADDTTEADVRAVMDRGEADPDAVMGLMMAGVISDQVAHDYLEARPVIEAARESSPVKVVSREAARGGESGSHSTLRGKAPLEEGLAAENLELKDEVARLRAELARLAEKKKKKRRTR
ncbi:hypothetical protein ACHQM5_009380 [Ranunculus cassubicifolius]